MAKSYSSAKNTSSVFALRFDPDLLDYLKPEA